MRDVDQISDSERWIANSIYSNAMDFYDFLSQAIVCCSDSV